MTAEQRIIVIGCGYVGTVVAGSFARIDRHVVGVEVDGEKLARLRSGQAPFHEPQLDVLLRHGLARGMLEFTDSAATVVPSADVIFFCLASPDGGKGRADMSQIESAIDSIVPHLRRGQVVVTKSTLPLGANDWIQDHIAEQAGFAVPVVANPEFLREGSAVEDFLHPDRVVLGADDGRALDLVLRAYRPILDQTFERIVPLARGEQPRPELVVTSRRSAEVVKFAANSFLASRVSLINEISEICEAYGADIDVVAAAVGMDSRIGPHFLKAGLGWGGSCFDKDLAILARQARDAGVEPALVEAARRANRTHRRWVVDLIGDALGGLEGRTVAVLGLSFKPDTDDLRDSPAVELAERLMAAGAVVRAHDPAVAKVPELPGLEVVPDPVTAAVDADAIVLATDWREYSRIDFAAAAAVMRGRLAFDARNVWDRAAVEAAGLRYRGIGRADQTRLPRRADGESAVGG